MTVCPFKRCGVAHSSEAAVESQGDANNSIGSSRGNNTHSHHSHHSHHRIHSHVRIVRRGNARSPHGTRRGNDQIHRRGNLEIHRRESRQTHRRGSLLRRSRRHENRR